MFFFFKCHTYWVLCSGQLFSTSQSEKHENSMIIGSSDRHTVDIRMFLGCFALRGREKLSKFVRKAGTHRCTSSCVLFRIVSFLLLMQLKHLFVTSQVCLVHYHFLLSLLLCSDSNKWFCSLSLSIRLVCYQLIIPKYLVSLSHFVFIFVYLMYQYFSCIFTYFHHVSCSRPVFTHVPYSKIQM